MNNKTKKILLIVLAVVLVAELAFLGVAHFAPKDEEMRSNMTESATEATQAPTEATVEMTEPTEAPTEATEATEASTEPTGTEPVDDNRYVLTFVGDCTFGSTSGNWNNSNHFIKTVGTNYDWPFDNVRDYFEEDDFTMINLEGVLADSGTAASKLFAFRGPTAYTQIMTGSSVEAVTLANNHTEDYGSDGYASTTKALTDAGITYVEENKTALFTTESGLVIGLYADAFDFSTSSIRSNISSLKKAGAEIIVCAFHWGSEGHYRPSNAQQSFAHTAIDAGADIVYGHHPHVLQKIEEYGDGIIYYSLGNFSFGGAATPGDFDTAMIQQEVIRNEDGSVSLGELTIIPMSVSSIKGRNNFQPALLDKDSTTYARVLSKLDGTFTGPNLNVDYSNLKGDNNDQPADPPATSGSSGSAGSGNSGSTDSGNSGSTGSGDSGSTGSGDSGSSGSGNSGSSGSGDSGSSGSGNSGSTDSGNSGSTDSGNSGSTGSSDSGSSGSGDSGSSGSGDSGSSGSSDAGAGSSADSGSGSSADAGSGDAV